MNRRSFLTAGASTFAWAALAKPGQTQMFRGQVPDGPFQPDWESLKSYQCPDWYRDAKLGIWAHWSPQCVPEDGDWYARNMYIQGTPQFEFHVKTYGHPSKFGYKDVCHLWKAERWDPEALIRSFTQERRRCLFRCPGYPSRQFRLHGIQSISHGMVAQGRSKARHRGRTWAKVARSTDCDLASAITARQAACGTSFCLCATRATPSGRLREFRTMACRPSPMANGESGGKAWTPRC